MLHPRTVLAFTLLVALCAATFVRSFVYESEVTLYADAVAKSPNKARPNNNFGDALKKAGRAMEAGPYFERALEIQPAYPDALNNLGTIYNGVNKKVEAMELFTRALSLAPSHVQARSNIAMSFYEQRMFRESIAHYEILIQQAPTSKEAVFARKMVSMIQRQGMTP